MPKKAAVNKGDGKERKSPRVNSAKSTRARKKAVVLLSEWADQMLDIELGSAGVQFIGTIHQLKIAPGIDDFIFRSHFGVRAMISPIIYDDITFDKIPHRSTRLFLRNKRIGGREIVLSRAMTTRPSERQIEEVYDRFRLWIKLNAELCLTVGDSLRSRASICTISEPNAGAFFFTNLRAATIDTLAPQQSELIKITSSNDRTTIDMYNRTTNTFVSVTDRMEPPERTFERFAAFTQTVQ